MAATAIGRTSASAASHVILAGSTASVLVTTPRPRVLAGTAHGSGPAWIMKSVIRTKAVQVKKACSGCFHFSVWLRSNTKTWNSNISVVLLAIVRRLSLVNYNYCLTISDLLHNQTASLVVLEYPAHTLHHVYRSLWPAREVTPRLVPCSYVVRMIVKLAYSGIILNTKLALSCVNTVGAFQLTKTSEFRSMLFYRVMDLDRRRSVLWCTVLPHPPADHYISMQTEAEISKPDEVRHNKPISDFRVDFRLLFKARPCAKSFI